MTIIFTGVGSRKIPVGEKYVLLKCAILLKKKGFKCRTGDAWGSDAIFKDVFGDEADVISPMDATDWSFEEVQKRMPNDRRYDVMKLSTKRLIARDMMQVLGRDGKSPSKFLLCYAPSLNYEDSSAGGTGYAIRCALAHGIPVFNIFSKEQGKAFLEFVNNL